MSKLKRGYSKLKREYDYTTLRIYHDTKQRLTDACPKKYNYSEFIDILMDVMEGRMNDK
jgi:hypothetical protein